MAFHTSTQRETWMFASAEALQAARADAYAAMTGGGGSNTAVTAPVPTLEEAATLLRHYEQEMLELCARGLPGPDSSTLVPFSMKVTATAVAYFKRYYIHNSILIHPPQSVMLLALFVACKAEKLDATELKILLGGRDPATQMRYTGLPPKDRQYIVTHEVEMMEALKFHLLVHSPLRPLRGLLVQYQTLNPEAACSRLEAAATKLVESWLASDVILLHPPSQVALAAFTQAASELDTKKEAAEAGGAGAAAGSDGVAVDADGFVKSLCEADEEKATKLRATLRCVQATAAAWAGSATKAADAHKVKETIIKLAVYQAAIKESKSGGGGNDAGSKRKRGAGESPDARKAPGTAAVENSDWT